MTLGQDSSLGIFHAVAKVLYNRRKLWAGSLERHVTSAPSETELKIYFFL